MTLPLTMTQIAITAPGGPDVLRSEQVTVPSPAAGELLVRVAAAGVNRPDVLQRLGKYPLPPDALPIPGLEIAGEVAALGDGVTSHGVGEQVCGLTNGGGYAEYCRFPAGQALPWPQGFDAIQAAALPETFFTVWANLFQMGKARAGETALVHGGSSGIGTTAIMLLKAFGLRVLATVGSDQKCTAIRQLGADVAINYRTQDFPEVVQRETQGRGVDVILDIMGASYWERNIAALAKDGRLLLIGTLGGAKAEYVNLGAIMAKRLHITGSAMRPRSAAEKTVIRDELLQQVWPLLDAGQISPVIHATFPLAQAADAHRLLETSQHIGKIVLAVL